MLREIAGELILVRFAEPRATVVAEVCVRLQPIAYWFHKVQITRQQHLTERFDLGDIMLYQHQSGRECRSGGGRIRVSCIPLLNQRSQ